MSALAISRGPAGSEDKEDVNITFEDQQKINKFARQTSRMTEIEEEIKNKKKELQNLQDAADELELADEDDSVPFRIGEVFVYQSSEEALALVGLNKQELEGDVTTLNKEVDGIKEILSQLKVQLYTKFGNNINLEMEDE